MLAAGVKVGRGKRKWLTQRALNVGKNTRVNTEVHFRLKNDEMA